MFGELYIYIRLSELSETLKTHIIAKLFIPDGAV